MTYEIKQLIIGSDDDDLTPEIIKALPTITCSTISHGAEQLERAYNTKMFGRDEVTTHHLDPLPYDELDEIGSTAYQAAKVLGYELWSSMSDTNEFNEIMYLARVL